MRFVSFWKFDFRRWRFFVGYLLKQVRHYISQVKEILRQQATPLRFDEGRAIAAISKMLPNDPGRRALALAAIYNVITAIGEPDLDMVRRFQDISRLFESTDRKREAFSGPSNESVRPE